MSVLMRMQKAQQAWQQSISFNRPFNPEVIDASQELWSSDTVILLYI